MEVRPGYKQTEVGVIPVEWETVRLGDVSAFITKGSTPTTYGFGWQSSGFLFLRSECVSPEGLDLAQSMFISAEANRALRRSAVQSNDLLITITGNVGRVVRLPGDFGEANINQHIARIRIVDEATHPGWVYHFLSQSGVRQHFEKITTGQAYPQISLVQVRDAVIPRPATTEQRAIAAALSDVDALLGGLDRLIAKKRDLKQAAMQQLLTGQTRLLGFSGEWAPLNMAQKSLLKARIGWQGLTTAEYLASGSYRLVTGTDFSSGRVNWDTCPFVAADRYEQDRNIQLRANDVLVTKDGTIGKVAFVDELPGPATLNSGVFVIRPKGNAYQAKFLYCILASAVFEDFLRKLAAGSTISHLYQKDFVSFEFLAPPTVEEQAAIADALGDMDAELAALGARRDKTRDLKQAMMQELLTGKTRLVPAGAAHA